MSRKTRLLLTKVGITAFLLLLNGCAGFSINAQMCDPSGPNGHNLPKECYAYSEDEAEKSAFPEEETPCNNCSKPKLLELDK